MKSKYLIRSNSFVEMIKSMLALLCIAAVLLAGCRSDGKRDSAGPSKLIEMAGGGNVTINTMKQAEELPDAPEAVFGIVDHVDGNSIFVNQLPPLELIASQGYYDIGPIVEVVVTNNSLVYKALPLTDAPVDGVYQQKVAPGSVDEIESGDLISVWGEQRGDRILTEVLSYNNHSKIVLPGDK
jgi:hypothetical protein